MPVISVILNGVKLFGWPPWQSSSISIFRLEDSSFKTQLDVAFIFISEKSISF